MPKIGMQAIAAVVILVVGYLIGVWTGPDTDEIEAQVAALQAKIDEQGGIAASAEVAAGEAKSALDALAAKVEEQASAMTEASGGLGAIQEQFAALEGSLTETVGNLEAQVHDQVSGLESAIGSVKGDLEGYGASIASLKEEAASIAQQVASGPTEEPSDYQTAMAPADQPMGEPEEGIQRLGVGASAWAVEGLVSVSLSSITGEDSARIFVNGQPVELMMDETVRLRGLPAEAGNCTATLKGIGGGMADVAVDCAS